MKIGVFTRTFRDLEEKHIQRFLESHSFADTIYLGTCQTSEQTLAIANQYANVKFREFGETITLADGTINAHESQFYLFLLHWAQEENVDTVLLDDVDHICNSALQRDARRLIEESQKPLFFTLLMYYWGTQLYFPKLNDIVPNERLWGWNMREWTPDINPAPANTIEIRNQPDPRDGNAMVFPHPPYVIKHFSFLTEEDTRRKMEFNIKRGVPQTYPLESCGSPELIPDWVDNN